MKPVYIEFVGVPGVGKTTISKSLEVELEKDNFRVVKKSCFFKEKDSFTFLLKIRVVFSQLHYFPYQLVPLAFYRIRKRGSLSTVESFLVAINLVWRKMVDVLLVRYILQSGKYDYVINDEGLSKICDLATLTNCSKDKCISLARDIIPSNSILVLLDVSSEKSIKRAKHRKSNPKNLKKILNFDVDRTYKDILKTYDLLFSRMKKDINIKTFVVDNNHTPSFALKKIMKFILEKSPEI